MKIYISLAAALLWCSPLFAQPAVVRVCTGFSFSNQSSASLTISPTPGDNIQVGVGIYNNGGTVSTVKLSNGTACTEDKTVSPGSTAEPIYLFTCPNVPSGITGINVTFAASVGNAMGECAEVSGEATSSWVDVAGTGNYNTTASWTTGPVSTGNASDIVWGYLYDEDPGTLTSTSPWTTAVTTTDSSNEQADILTYQVVSSTGSYNPSGGGGNSDSGGLTVAYEAVPAVSYSGSQFGGKASFGGKAVLGP